MSKQKPSINEKMTQLDELLAWFDSDDFELEEAIGRFEDAEKLASSIEQDLSDMKNTITVISQRFDKDK